MTTKKTIRPKDGYHHGDLGQALVSAVRRLIERDGPANFSISEACKMAGVSTAAPYKHFADKQDILYHVARSGFEDLTQAMAAASADRSQGQVHVITQMGKAYVRFALDHPGTFRLMFGSSPNVKDDPTVNATGHTCFSTLIGEVGNHLGPDSSDTQAKQLAILLWTFVHGAASLAIDKDYDAADIPVDVEALVEQASRQLLARHDQVLGPPYW